MADKRPIGVFDSGLGGLTVVKSLRKLLPNESIVYFGDTARVPYGNKSPELIQEFSKEITEFLVDQDAKMIVVACNTATARALDSLKEHTDVHVIGVIDPGAKEAIKATKNKHIGIIGTESTISSKAYEHALAYLDETIETSSHACPLLVPLAEEGWLDGDVADKIIAHYLKQLNSNNIDTLILGCTHYPLLKNAIASQVNEQVVLIDSADAIAKVVLEDLTSLGLMNDSSEEGTLSCFVTDIPLHFESIGQRFLGSKIDHVQTVHDL